MVKGRGCGLPLNSSGAWVFCGISLGMFSFYVCLLACGIQGKGWNEVRGLLRKDCELVGHKVRFAVKVKMRGLKSDSFVPN